MTALLRFRLRLFLGFTLFVAHGAGAQPTPIDLGDLGGSFTRPSGVNNRGQVVGLSTTVDDDLSTRRAFLWTETTGMVDLGTLGNRGSSSAFAVNDRGQVAGTSGPFAPPAPPGQRALLHAVVWTKQDGIVDLGTLTSAGSGSFGGPINNRERVVGTSDISLGSHAFSWTPRDGMVDLGTLGGRIVFPSALNDSDQVVGTSYLNNDANIHGPRHAFSWTPAGGMVDLGTLGGPSSGAEDINEKGQVVGWAEIDESLAYHAFLWTSTEGMVDLGTLGGTSSYAYDVNEAGAVVGFSFTTGDAEVHAFLWTAAHGMVDLGTLGGTNSFAWAVNDQGQVVGRSQTADNPVGHGFVWSASEGMVDLAPLTGHAHSDAYLVNNSGHVVGISYSQSENSDARATMWRARGPSGDVTTSSSR